MTTKTNTEYAQAVNKLATSPVPTLTAAQLKVVCKAGYQPDISNYPDILSRYFPASGIDPISLLMPLTALSPVTSPDVEARYWLMGVSVCNGWALATNASAVVGIPVGNDIGEGMYYNSIYPSYKSKPDTGGKSVEQINGKVRSMLKTHVNTVKELKAPKFKLSLEDLARMKQLSKRAYKLDTKANAVYFPALKVAGQYYDSRQISAVANILVHSLPEDSIQDNDTLVLMQCVDSVDNPIIFKAYSQVSSEKPRLCSIAAVMPMRDRKTNGRIKTDILHWAYPTDKDAVAPECRVAHEDLFADAYPIPGKEHRICLRLPDSCPIHATPGSMAVSVILDKSQARELIRTLDEIIESSPVINDPSTEPIKKQKEVVPARTSRR